MKVKALKKCFVEGSIREKNEIFEYNGILIPCIENLEQEENSEGEDSSQEASKRKKTQSKKTQNSSAETQENKEENSEGEDSSASE